jgi:hypothetical protein
LKGNLDTFFLLKETSPFINNPNRKEQTQWKNFTSLNP